MNSTKTKVLITGAHFTPAVAVIEGLKKYPGVEVIYVGRSSTMEGDKSKSAESQILPQLGIRFIPIISGRLQRSFTIYTIPSLLKIPIGFIQALYIILKEKPDVILSFGGYVAVPVVFMAWLFSKPILVHEQTLVCGLANKISSLFADKIALSFNKTNEFDKSKTIITGNPIRRIVEANRAISGSLSSIFNQAKKEKLPVILVTGGNQGSHIINQTVEESLPKLLSVACVIHVTGDNKYKDFERLKLLENEKYIVRKWIGDEYGAVLQKVDLVVSRAGINTLSELAYIGKNALVIPFAPIYKDEQNKNAKYFENQGLVKILPQTKLSSTTLIENLKQMLANLQELKQKAKLAKTLVIPDASKRLALETILLTKHS